LIILILSFVDISVVIDGADTGSAAVILVTVHAALHAAVVGMGYVMVERDCPQTRLLGLNLGLELFWVLKIC
jgi:hypothetical protein